MTGDLVELKKQEANLDYAIGRLEAQWQAGVIINPIVLLVSPFSWLIGVTCRAMLRMLIRNAERRDK